MRIFELHSTTGYTGLIVSVRATYTTQRAYKILAEKAFDIYKKKVEADPIRLSQFELRLVIWERQTDKDGIFRTVRTTYKDFRFVDGKVILSKEQNFTK